MEVRKDISEGDGVDASIRPNVSETGDDELSRRERERLLRRRLMLEAARAVFAEKGYADATLDEIAQRAEFGKGTLYNYFKEGKEAILFAVFDDLYDDLEALIRRTFNPELVEHEPFREVFEGFLTAAIAFFVERQEDFMIMMKEGHRLTFNEEPEKGRYFMERSDRIVHALLPGIEAAAKKGVIRNFPPISVANMILGNVKGYHMHTCMRGCREAIHEPNREALELPAPEESARFLTTFLLDGILA